MSIDLRVKHDLESRRRAVELFDAGVGCKPAAEALSVPRETVREWQWVYRAFGSEALLSMGGKQSSYTFEQRVAAASAVVDGGMAKADAMAEFGIRSKSPLERVSVNLFFTSFANQTRRSRKGGFTACANVFSPIPVTL